MFNYNTLFFSSPFDNILAFTSSINFLFFVVIVFFFFYLLFYFFFLTLIFSPSQFSFFLVFHPTLVILFAFLQLLNFYVQLTEYEFFYEDRWYLILILRINFTMSFLYFLILSNNLIHFNKSKAKLLHILNLIRGR